MQLPKQLPWTQAANQWPAILNPVIANPMNSISILKGVKLVIGVNVINHKLGQMQQGYTITSQRGPAVIYQSADFNSLTLTLTSDAAVTVDIGVF